MYGKPGCRSPVEEPDEAAFLWCNQGCRELSFCLGLGIEDGSYDFCFADSHDKKQYHTRLIDHT